MKMKTIGNTKINNGDGLYDNVGLVDSLIVDCNNAVKEIVNGQYIAFCNLMVQMVRKLANLKKGINDDIHGRDDIIESLKQELGQKSIKENDDIEKSN